MSDTALDIAHRRMQEDDSAAPAFYLALANSEIFLLLTGEAVGDAIEPQLLEVDGERFVLGFDTEERLAEFAGQAADFAALSGRALVSMLVGQGIGLGLNLQVAESESLLPIEALTWLADMLYETPVQVQGVVRDVSRPDLSQSAVMALDANLARAGGLALGAWLVKAGYENGQSGHLLAVVDAVPGAEEAIAKSVSDALVFSGAEGDAVDVTFLSSGDDTITRIARVGLRFDLPEPEQAESVKSPGAAPGMDPSKPPILK